MNKGLLSYLESSYTAYQAVENAVHFLEANGFQPLKENKKWKLSDHGKYYVVRGGSALIAFTLGKNYKFKIVASHTDSPCLKLKENPVNAVAGMKTLNVEPYGGGIWYSFFDRPLKIAGRIIREKQGALVPENYVSPFTVTIPSLAVHMNREVNDKFAPNPQVDLLPLFSLDDVTFEEAFGDVVSYDLYAACADSPFENGAHGRLVTSPRVDNLTSVYSSLRALVATEQNDDICVAACLDNEEIGSRTRQGAGGDFLRAVLLRIAASGKMDDEDTYRALSSSYLISLDNAHGIHPNHPEKCDPTNRAALGKGIVIKGHAGGAYTTDAMTSAVIKTVFKKAEVRYQTFYNRSDMRSGSTLGAISLGQVSIPSVDLGLAQLAMHSAMETFCKDDYIELEKGLKAFYASDISLDEDKISVEIFE